jgi:hypothetical protein
MKILSLVFMNMLRTAHRCKLLLGSKFHSGPVAQLDRASDFGSEGWGFDSLRGRQNLKAFRPLSGRRLKLSAYISASDLLLQNPDPTNWRRFPNSGLTDLNFCLFLHSSFPANIRREQNQNYLLKCVTYNAVEWQIHSLCAAICTNRNKFGMTIKEQVYCFQQT